MNVGLKVCIDLRLWGGDLHDKRTLSSDGFSVLCGRCLVMVHALCVDDKSVSVPLCAEDIKFIWNGRVLTSAEDLIDACQQYFSSIPLEKEGDEILTLHAVVRPPKPPMKKKGKKKIDSRHSSENVANTRGGLDCSCCVIM